MSGRAWRLATRRAAAFGVAGLLLAGLAACGPGPKDPSATPPSFTVGALTFEVVSAGVYRSSGRLLVFLTDQADTCLAVNQVPVLTATYLAFTVAPPAAAPLTATVVVNEAGPSAGQATGTLTQRTGGVLEPGGYTAADGTMTWSGGSSGDLTLEALDAGFGGVSGRVALTGLRLAACD